MIREQLKFILERIMYCFDKEEYDKAILQTGVAAKLILKELNKYNNKH